MADNRPSWWPENKYVLKYGGFHIIDRWAIWNEADEAIWQAYQAHLAKQDNS